ncbi:MAG: Uma2 family endonuclease [Microcystaceae cyanobacterium]
MIITQPPIKSDTWITGTWDEYLTYCNDPQLEKAKFYYYNQRIRIEMPPFGSDHARDHGIIGHAIYLYATLKNILLNGKDNCSYRKVGKREAQPDLSFYIGDNANAIPYGTSIVNLDQYPPPNLVVEVAKTSLRDDIGEKRLLYEDMNVQEYWIVDVEKIQIIAFKIDNGGSWRIDESQLLLGLSMTVLREALRMTRENTHSEVSRWLMQQFQA